LDNILHIFGLLKRKYNSRMAFDPTVPLVDESAFKECNWKEFHSDVSKAIPTNAPVPHGTGISLQMYVDSKHTLGKRRQDNTIRVPLFLLTVH